MNKKEIYIRIWVSRLLCTAKNGHADNDDDFDNDGNDGNGEGTIFQHEHRLPSASQSNVDRTQAHPLYCLHIVVPRIAIAHNVPAGVI